MCSLSEKLGCKATEFFYICIKNLKKQNENIKYSIEKEDEARYNKGKDMKGLSKRVRRFMNNSWKMYALEDEKVINTSFAPKTVADFTGLDGAALGKHLQPGSLKNGNLFSCHSGG